MNDPRETIKHLLRLAKDPTAAEAGRALAKARELAIKYSLSMEDLQLEADLEAIAEKAFRAGRYISHEHKLAANVASSYFNVETILSSPDILIFGTQTDIIIAEYVIEYLVGTSQRALAKFRGVEKRARRKWSITKRANFMLGFFSGIHSALMPPSGELPSPDREAIVLRHNARVQAFIDERYGNAIVSRAPTKRRAHSSAQAIGFYAGRAVKIHDPIEERTTPRITSKN